MKTVLNKNMLFVAARLNSTRLTSKVLRPIYGVPLLERMLERLTDFFLKEDIVICSSTNSQDDQIEQFCNNNKVFCFRGEELDVMKRFIDASNIYKPKTIARITGDNPLTDPEMLLHMFKIHERNKVDYTYNQDMPVGTRAEVIDVKAMKYIHSQLYDPSNSEYMTYMLNRPDKIKTLCISAIERKCARPEISLTVDHIQDLECMENIYSYFNGTPPKLKEIISFLDKNENMKIVVSQVSKNLSKDIKFSFKGDFNH